MNKLEELYNIIKKEVSREDLINPASPKEDNDILPSSEQKKMVAVLANWVVKAHPGFSETNVESVSFSDEVKEGFSAAMLGLYHSEVPRTSLDMQKEFAKIGLMHLPDNHFNIFSSDGRFVQESMTSEEKTQLNQELVEYLKNPKINPNQKGKIETYLSKREQVGQNVFKKETLEELGANIISDKKAGSWRISELEKEGKKITVLGLSSFAAFDEKGQFDAKKIEDFTAFAEEFAKGEYKNADSIVLDLRGNGGGWPYLGDYLARTLYGNTVYSEPKTVAARDTLETKLSLAYMRRMSLEERKELAQKSYSGKEAIEQSKELWSQKSPYNSELGFSKPIIVLTDKSTGSNAELTCERLKPHPYVRFVGENTLGCVQYSPAATGGLAIPLPYGGKVAVPVRGASSSLGERLEGLGVSPDYAIEKGQNALRFYLENSKEIDGSIQKSAKNMVFKKVETQAEPEKYVQELTAKNLKAMKDNAPAQEALLALANATKTIPQLQKTYSLSTQRTTTEENRSRRNNLETFKNRLADNKYQSILDSVSDKELLAEYPQQKEGIISPAAAKKDIAFFAKTIQEAHVSWSEFPDEVRKNFQNKIVELYQGIEKDISVEDMRNKLTEAVAIVPDLHTFVSGADRGNIYANEPSEPSVGKNIIHNPEKYGVSVVAEGEFAGEIAWQIGQTNSNGKNNLVISIPSSRSGNWETFIDSFDKIYEEGSKWDKVIVDARGNPGGSTSKPFKHMAEKLYGNKIDDVKDFSVRSSEASNHHLHKMYKFVQGLYTRTDPSLEPIQDFVAFENKKDEVVKIMDNTHTVYPQNKEKSFKKPIDVLIDRETGSAAEFGVANFQNIPNARFVGENSKGISQYSISIANTPSGVRFQFGVAKSNFYAGNAVECQGFSPDINIARQGKDAFEVALSNDEEGRGKERYEDYLTTNKNAKVVYEDISAKDKYKDDFVVNPWKIEKGIEQANKAEKTQNKMNALLLQSKRRGQGM